MPCTAMTPCLKPLLRWVHSRRCTDITRKKPPMNFETYRTLSLSTLPDLTNASVDEINADITVLVLGLCEEVGEVLSSAATSDTALHKKELGDAWWYGTALSARFDMPPLTDADFQAGHIPHGDIVPVLVTSSAELAGKWKKYLGHGHDLDRSKFRAGLRTVLRALTACDPDYAGIWEMNVEKRRKRYPDGFSEDRSRNRVE